MDSMVRPVWLFSLDTQQFTSVPMTTGRLKAYHQKYGKSRADIQLVHFTGPHEVAPWLEKNWTDTRWFRRPFFTSMLERARSALKQGLQPVAGFSVYTWNADVFLSATQELRKQCPELLVVAGGPHVQYAKDYLYEDGIDVVVQGEGEQTFQELLDCKSRSDWHTIKGLAFLENGQLVKTAERERAKDLDEHPSALDVVPLTNAKGEPLYTRVAYETTRGCPFKCSFCEWGTGAIGTKMYQHSLERIRSDLERLVDAGVRDIWLCDSNFGALREDLDKAKIIVELRKRTGRPGTFGTSWSKNHNERVQQIVLMLQRHGLLQQYVLALQTLTPLALKLSNRKNMRSNQYEPIAKRMAEQKVPISTELIWGLPGDNLAEFEQNLDRLSRVFPNINIYGYTMLPGTEFFERREEYQVETIPVAGYGKAKGEYVVGCHTFSRDEGIEGYFLISAHILLVRGHIMPLTTRFLALSADIPVSGLLRTALRAATDACAPNRDTIDWQDRMALYENRVELYLGILGQHELLFETLRRVISTWLTQYGSPASLLKKALAVLDVDKMCCPRVGPNEELFFTFDFDALTVWHRLHQIEAPDDTAFDEGVYQVCVDHPGGVGVVLNESGRRHLVSGQTKARRSVGNGAKARSATSVPGLWVTAVPVGIPGRTGSASYRVAARRRVRCVDGSSIAPRAAKGRTS